jgi:hypothetical protein
LITVAWFMSIIIQSSPAHGYETAQINRGGCQVVDRSGGEPGTPEVLMVLRTGDFVRLIFREGQQASVKTPEGVEGWTDAACLREAPNKGVPQTPEPQLRQRLQEFLAKLRAAAESQRPQDLEPLLDQEGVWIEGVCFKDAGRSSQEQTPALVKSWYANEPIMTYGTAWELLVKGADPGTRMIVFDADGRKRLAKPGEKGDRTVKVRGTLPYHLQALGLAKTVRLVQGFPEEIAGDPEPQKPPGPEKTRRLPFARVFQLAPDCFYLEQVQGWGLFLVVTDRPGAGLKLRAIHTGYAPL